MSTEQQSVQNDELSKSIDALLDEVFSETVEKGGPGSGVKGHKTFKPKNIVPKKPKHDDGFDEFDAAMSRRHDPAHAEEDEAAEIARMDKLEAEGKLPKINKGSPLDLASDSKTTADAAVKQAPSSLKDESRGAGRPKQISDIPQTDMDGRRDSEFDSSISEKAKEEDQDEAEQSKAIDQVSKEGRMASSPSAPKVAPFKKSEVVLTEEELKEFEEFKKSKQAAEELKKAELVKKEQEELVKSAVAQATAKLAKENEELRKSFEQTNALIKAMASQPVRSKSITGIEALEKSQAPEEKGSETFSKAEVLDAAFELAKSGKIPAEAVSEIEMTGRCADADVRSKIEKQLSGK